jgi:type I restriction-modification system DNA methylase subunit/restriction endonuclease S subunit
MKKFLGEDVTYIEDAEIDKAFRRFKNDPDATRKTIKDYFRALKFFSDNDFSFISVHNKKLFQQNAIILRKVILMLQDIRLKNSDTHQFLGDLFEGFLTKGVKQSEGQFFTPMPIVRFIVTSLPLEQLIKDSQDIPYAIDYACGAGHFLTEYADRIKDFVRMYRPDLSLHDYYSRIMGIEKEYRLSKVSKVSAFMYGHDETQIVYSDALKSHPNVEEGKYSVLIANPPYSVSGFLETLSDQDRKKYKLFNSNINLAKNNAIETFFIERAAQLMKAGGVAGIILPVSVLNKGGIYAKAREIILENFHIVSLVELGSGTFGKTGTNTVVMFLRRKETNTPDADHYANRVECWFNLSESGDEVYQDTELMEKYCEHLGYAVDDYQEFLKGNMTETFIKSEVVQTYHNSFFGTSRNAMKDVCDEAKNIRARYVAKTKTATFRALSADEKKKEADRTFYAFVKAIEREKMYFFMLAVQTENPVLLVKSPLPKKNESNEKIKKFLGYEWINRKGHEGIHYLNVGAASSDEDAEENEADDNTMQEISGINAINTCLFNPNDFNDTEKINYLIRQSFMDGEFDVSVKLEEYVDLYRTVDLIDFSRTAFDKTIKTTPMLAYPKFETSLPTEKLGDIAPFVTEKVSYTKISPKSYISTDNMLQNKAGVVAYNGVPNIGRVTLYRKGDILISNIRPYLKKIYLAKTKGGCSNDVLVFRNTKDNILNDYLYAILSNDLFFEFMMTGKTGLKMPRGDKKMIPNFGIPVPSVEIQKKIVSECSKTEELYQKCIYGISRLKGEIDSVLADSHSKATTDIRLDNEQVFNLSIGRRVLKSELKKDGAYEVFSANVFEPFGRTDSSLLTDFSIPSVLWGIDGDWMVNYLQADRPFHPTDHCGVIKVLDENVILPKYLVYPLLKAGEHERFSRANRASTERIKALTIRVPSINIQKETVSKVIEIENEINTLKQKMKECKFQKQVILDKYLK